jgi:hypothetical protein
MTMSLAKPRLRHVAYLAGMLCASAAVGCTPAQKKPMVSTALSDRETRHESFEATLRELDQHPEYVDELFQLALAHPATLDRLLHDTAQELRDQGFARRAAGHLASEPEGLKATLIATMYEIQHEPRAQQAFIAALDETRDLNAAVLARHPDVMARLFKAIAKRGVDRGQDELAAFVKSLEP